MTAPSPRVRQLSRRAFLAGAGAATAALAGGCGAAEDVLGNGVRGSAAPPRSGDSSDDRTLASALSDQEQVLAYCLAVRAAHKPLRSLLSPLVDHHRTHVQILGGDPSARRPDADVPSNRSKALQHLRGVEHTAARRRSTEASRAQAGEFARVLAGIAASQEQHVYLLDRAMAEKS